MRAHDCLHLFVDGVLHQAQGENQIDRVLTTSVVYAIEVYENPNMVPLQFQASLPPKRGLLTTKAGCGAIVVWTKSRAG